MEIPLKDLSLLKIPIQKWGTMMLDLPWPEILGELWKYGRKVMRGLSTEGMYEVLEFESTLELKDNRGARANVKKRQKVRYLQDNIIAYQDHAWGDGEILINYRCTPGKPVDRYRPGKKTLILISRREVKHRGDVDTYNIEWDIRKGFTRSKELWETEIKHRTKELKVEVIFPKTRPPLQVLLVEGMRRRTRVLNGDHLKKLPDGRWLVTWEITRPRLYERYILQWEW